MRLVQGLCRAAAVRPAHIATIDERCARTWAQTAERVARLGAAFQALGISPGERIAVLAQNSTAFFEAYFAIFWAGGVIVPLNTRLALPELAFQLKDAGVDLLLFGEEFASVAAELKAQGAVKTLIGLDHAGGPADHALDELIAQFARAPEQERSDNDLAGIFYTGGTTGLPKGVMLSHRNLWAMAVNLTMELQVDESCINLHSAPMFHLADIGIFMVTMVAATHVFVRKLDDEAMLRAIEREKITHLFTVPVVIDRLAQHPLSQTADLRSLQVMGYGGAPMPAGVYLRARERFADVDFVQGFGMTEMGAHTFLGRHFHRAETYDERLKSAGRACYGYELKVVDADGGDLPPRAIGEIVGRGDNVMLGYWNQPEETAKALRGGWMHSQDAGFLDEDGYIYITDRLKDMIVSGGENVYSIEVESVISRHPAVAECAIVGVPDERWGERVHAIIVPKPAAEMTFDELIGFCRQQIAAYKIPKSMDLRAEPLPRSAAGKVLKADLRNPFWPDQGRKV